jgi:predicted MPP superfamily phosphohydrolase
VGSVLSYLWWRMVAGPFRSRRLRIGGALLILALCACIPVGLRHAVGGSNWLLVLSWIGLVWAAVLFYLLLTLVVLEPFRLAARVLLAQKPIDHDVRRTGMDRRTFLARATALTAGVTALGTVGYGVAEARSIHVKRVSITLPDLDPALDGFRFAVLADVHLSETLRRPFLHRVVERVNGLGVDAVAIVGDLVSGTVDDLGDDARELTGLRSAHGTYFVTGNHEWYFGAQEWIDYLPTLGLKVLRNERISIARGGANFDLAGVDDLSAEDWGHGLGPNLDAALDGRDTGRPVVLLAHQPAEWPDAVKYGVDLQLSGHTHGGQMWPYGYVVRREQPVLAGLATRGKSQIYVSKGVGYRGPPVRVGAGPEISLIELSSSL